MSESYKDFEERIKFSAAFNFGVKFLIISETICCPALLSAIVSPL